ncbi:MULTISPECIES: CDP-diacylglycerol--glycerol-3-phosphate 3-phosphatidyltransferase [Deefgea]|uniref:CDP-diacylglycerol--glycerol-3-phosphate 3-phosphatidyltransferase n=1 Tax=Deefgea piscis TaxID=2739061 RepID=A0A6M8SYD9_9NEIS|nr:MULTISPECIES: CDP-diacylglycerol--glycerol-3-phosphate 3-phosphatidyltransferase [Deefgea]MBM5575663.1 CDP-diacylglycerol--glycerol-3-phosphate 3-phosphatidyltransferase [Deefgea sp. CFH1-16]QKJ67629.1 CDP-diacylglycerol--glycerol-3-phosphate 3-phosphatidyltransferase [Deefgea piscis]
MPFNLPIFLTWLRVALIPVFVGVFSLPYAEYPLAWQNMVGASLFMLAAVTDWFDGFLARRWNQTSQFGAFLDPVADKLMVAAALILLVQLDRTESWLAVIIIGREITISALREWMAQLGKAKSVAVNLIGKLKTTAQMIAIVLLLWSEPLIPGVSTQLLGTLALYIAAILTIWSMFYYLRVAAEQFREHG